MQGGIPALPLLAPQSIAKLLGLTLASRLLRYGCLSIIFACLYGAAIIFGHDVFFASIAMIVLAYAIIFFTVYYWFLVLRRNRSILKGDIAPDESDSRNPDMRNTVVFVCLQIALATPLLLYLLNPVLLGYEVSGNALGTRQLLCGSATSEFCASSKWAFEILSWFILTMAEFVRAVPVIGDDMYQIVSKLAGIKPRLPWTTWVVAHALQFLVVYFFVSIVLGRAKAVDAQMDDAIGLLERSPRYAAALGPMMLERLAEIVQGPDGTARRNAILAVSDIAKDYPHDTTRVQICKNFEARALELFHELPSRNSDDRKGRYLAAVGTLLCRMQSPPGVAKIKSRVLLEKEFVEVKRTLVRVLAFELPPNQGLALMRQLLPAARGNVLSDIKYHIEMLTEAYSDDEIAEQSAA